MIATTITQALVDVTAERRRQVTHEKFSVAHDDQHTGGELAKAAISYVGDGLIRCDKAVGTQRSALQVAISSLWPWSPEWWKPTAYRQMLVRAAALLIAEIERLDRIADQAATPPKTEGQKLSEIQNLQAREKAFGPCPCGCGQPRAKMRLFASPDCAARMPPAPPSPAPSAPLNESEAPK